jgi:hypothetical protein
MREIGGAMAKKLKNKSKNLAKKAAKAVEQHGPLSGAVVALGALASSILASDKLRDAAEELITNAIVRASHALETVSESTGDAAKRLASGHGDHEEEVETEEQLAVGEGLPAH